MRHLLVFADDDSLFEQDQVRSVLEDIGCQNFREGQLIGSVLDCEFNFSGEKAIIRLSDDFKMVSMSNVSNAALKVAFEIQTRMARSLRLIDTNYSFDVSLSEQDSFEDLLQSIESGDEA